MAVRFEIGRQIPGTSNFAEIYCSRHIKQKSPDFEIPITVSLVKLCNNNRDTNIRISVWTKRDKMLNQIQTTVGQIESGTQQFNGTEGAQAFISDWELIGKPNFVDYLRSGWGISICGAIDYTGSNGNPSSPSSLHYLGPEN